MELLLLSNSRGPDGVVLSHAGDAIRELANHGGKTRTKVLFVPFAGVTNPWPEYTRTIREAFAPLGLDVTSIDDCGDITQQHAAVAAAELIVVGGGNTFQLVGTCRARGLLDAIAKAVKGGTPYIGWSAGANLSCPTISTTNDMPIVDPQGFGALNLIDFQINPHYTNALPEGHRGESRNQRIAEYLVANPKRRVLGLPEGDWLRVSGEASAASVTLHGPFDAVTFVAGAEPRTLRAGPVSF